MQAYNMRVSANAMIIKDGQILLIAFDDALSGFHYNLPGEGINPGESAHEALRREAFEEARAEIVVGRLLLVMEYEPERNGGRYGPLHKLGLFFACQPQEGCDPRLPPQPDEHQVGVEWIPLERFASVPLLPRVADRLLDAYQQNTESDCYLSLLS